MSELARLSFSIERPLLERLERLVEETGAANRSELLRHLIRDRLVERSWDRDEEVLGTITIVYDHHARRLNEKLVDLQHDHHDEILATTHVHLTHDLCAEMIMVRGRAGRIESIVEGMRQQKGVLHAALATSSTGADLA